MLLTFAGLAMVAAHRFGAPLPCGRAVGWVGACLAELCKCLWAGGG
jgi:hypothetical protein